MEHLISCTVCLSVHAVHRPRVADELAYEISSLSTCSGYGEIISSEVLVLAEAVSLWLE